MHIPAHEIGGGVVNRTFKFGERQLRRGDKLTGDQIRAMPAANRNALIDRKTLSVYPVGAATQSAGMDRHVVSRGFGKFDVVEGRKLNKESLTKAEATTLAGNAPAAARPRRGRPPKPAR